MYCNSDFHTGVCPAKKENGECVSQFHCRHQVVHPTNADRIRAMTDEELADNWMSYFVMCNRCAYQNECECDEFVTAEKCREGILEWFKQPADNDKNG